MVVLRRKKVTKYRARTTHGGGHRKKRRGAGSRGGRGKAGSGKRAGHKLTHALGPKGFTSKAKTKKSVTLSYFTKKRVEALVASGKASKEGNLFVIDLGALGYDKLIATGNSPLALKLHVAGASARAIEKVGGAGGEVVLPTSE